MIDEAELYYSEYAQGFRDASYDIANGSYLGSYPILPMSRAYKLGYNDRLDSVNIDEEGW